MFWYTGLPVVIAAAAAIMDINRAKVDNGWILLSLAAGFFLQWQIKGTEGILFCCKGAVFPVLLLFWLFYFRMLGPGDIKLFCALGGFLGAEKIFTCIICSFLLGAVISLAVLIFYGDFRQRLQYFYDYVKTCINLKHIKPYYRKGMELENIHFTVPVFLSILLYAGGVY